MEKCVTIASACMRYYRKKHLSARSLALETPCGWNGKRGQQSLKAYQWLEWHNTQQTAGVVVHAFNGGERTLQAGPRRYQVDGFNETTQTVYEFHGCLWHRCPVCFHGSMNKTTRLHPDRTTRKMYEATFQKQQQLQAHSYRVITFWECQWDQLRQRSDVAAFVILRQFTVSSLNPRDAFFAGRTNAVRLWHEIDEDQGEEIRCVNVTSLYPTVNKYDEYPVGHLTIVTHPDQEITRYFGIADCTVLPPPPPPKGLFHPVLPYRCKGKITFPFLSSVRGRRIAQTTHGSKSKSCSAYSLRSNSSLFLDRPKGRMLSTLGTRSFYAAAPTLWNSLPVNIREITSLSIFKKKLKAYLFNLAYNK